MRTTDHSDSPRSRDVNIRGVLLFAFWLAAGGIAVCLAVLGIFRGLQKTERAKDTPLAPMVAASLQRTPPEPRLEPNALLPRTRMNEEENAALSSYGWVNEKAGIVRIPIDRAMDLLAERGLPPAKPMPPPASAAAAPSPTEKRQ